jgi:hypothetical protein
MNVKIPIWLEDDPLQRKAGYKGISGNVVSGKEHLVIENFIKQNLPKVYRGSIKAVTRYPDKNLLIKTTSSYCMNIGRNHNSCGIYFFATPEGIRQKCLCSCNKLDGRKTGLCMDFTSGLYPFDENSRAILFPELDKNLFVEQTKKKKQQKDKKEAKFEPGTGTKAHIIKQEQKICDKLLGDIIGEKLS